MVHMRESAWKIRKQHYEVSPHRPWTVYYWTNLTLTGDWYWHWAYHSRHTTWQDAMEALG